MEPESLRLRRGPRDHTQDTLEETDPVREVKNHERERKEEGGSQVGLSGLQHRDGEGHRGIEGGFDSEQQPAGSGERSEEQEQGERAHEKRGGELPRLHLRRMPLEYRHLPESVSKKLDPE